MGVIRKINTMLTDRKISCRELTGMYLEVIERDNPILNAYVNITRDEALSLADSADRRLSTGERVSPLLGVPMALKDNISTKGIETTCCSKILKGYTPVYDATVYTRLKEHGAVLLGKSNMDEFAMGNTCETSCFGGAKNPWDISRVPGGSSGGSASAVAASLAAFALGSDTGGSVRQPGSWCGLVGLKPTYGAVSRYGLIAYASSLDQIGTLTLDTEDAAIVFDAISAHDPLDSTSNRSYKANTLESLENSVKGKTVGVIKECLKSLDDEVLSAVTNALKTFETLGAKVVYVDMPELETSLAAYYIIACAEASSNLGRYDGVRYGQKASLYDDVHDMMCKTRSQYFGSEVKRRILLGTYVLSEGFYNAYYKKATALRQNISKAFEKAFVECDVLFSPTTTHTASLYGSVCDDPTQSYYADLCTVPANLAGLPSVSVPCGRDKNGLPIGIQLTGNKFCEDILLNFAHKFEQEAGFECESKWGVKL